MALQIALPASGFGASSLRETVSNFMARRAAYRAAYNELNSLSNRELADIGISRADIVSIARQAANAK